jgi:periplasmic divalent cation tolerance protein
VRENECSQVVTTTDSAEDAERLARGVVEAQLGACAQVHGPIRSVYRWQDEVRAEAEWQVVVKTTTARVPELIAHLAAAHGYDVPEIIATPITAGHSAYLDWVRAETGREPGGQ